jgi:hypothetical protein
MNAEIKAQWLEALRGGEYQQGTDTLKRDDKFCCLGVLCDLHRKDTQENDWKHVLGVGYYLGDDATLPYEVLDWAGLSSFNPNVDFLGKIRSLGSLNDEGVKFADLADLIEQQL